MKRLYTLFVIFGLTFLSNPIFASDCNSAQNINPRQTLAQGEVDRSFSSETFSGLAECSGPDGQNDAWFRFTALSTSMYVQTKGSGNLDLAVELYDSCGGIILNCENNNGAGAAELLLLNGLTVGTTYFFRTYHAAVSIPNSDDFTVSVVYIPEVELRAIDCGVDDFTTNDIIKSTQPIHTGMVGYYQWRFTELEAPFNVYEIISPNLSNPNFRLFWLESIQYGRSYDVAVRVGYYPGPLLGEYGNVCTISLQDDVLKTELELQYANQFFDFCDIIGATNVSGADKYRWEFLSINGIEHAEGEYYHRLLRLYQVPGLRLGQFYAVSVFAQVNGMESPGGTQRFIFTNSFVPNTGLRNDWYPCGESYPINSQVQAVEICAAESYTWRFRNTSQPQGDLIYTRVGGNRFIRLEWVTGLISGDSYDLDIKASQGFSDGDYSSICNITIGPSTSGIMAGPVGFEVIETGDETYTEIQEVSDLYLTVVKSGSTDGQAVVFQIANTNDEMTDVKLFDLNGRLIDMRTVYATQDPTQVEWNVQGLTKGIYILSARTGDSVVSKKISIF